MNNSPATTHPSAEVSPQARIGTGTSIWHQAQIREGARIGDNCIIGKDVYVDFDVLIGNNVKVQNAAQIYHGAIIEDAVFIGPQVCLTNDRLPRAITCEGKLKQASDWHVEGIIIRYGASLGAGVIVLPGTTIGQFAMVAAGSVVTRDVPDHALVMGTPARLTGYACCCGRRMESTEDAWICLVCQWTWQPTEQTTL